MIANRPMATAHQSSVPNGLRVSLDGTALPATASPAIDRLLIASSPSGPRVTLQYEIVLRAVEMTFLSFDIATDHARSSLIRRHLIRNTACRTVLALRIHLD